VWSGAWASPQDPAEPERPLQNGVGSGDSNDNYLREMMSSLLNDILK
jgi:hypothetical protein